ncbi:MAG: hypothetical protein ACJ78M_08350 [Gemmatimonadaceae bacterium]
MLLTNPPDLNEIHRDGKKMTESAAYKSSVRTFASVNVRDSKRLSGRIGFDTQRSAMTKTVIPTSNFLRSP